MDPLCISSRKATAEAVNELKAKCKLVIGTHSGTFHQDEVIACFLLRMLGQYKTAGIVRTRDDSILDLCDIVVDVGGTYDPSANKFDHHQRTFEETWSTSHTLTKLSSAGLVWKHFGQKILTEAFGVKNEDSAAFLQEALYSFIFEGIDMNDNGVRICSGTPKYIGGMPSLSGSIAHANTSWILPHKQDETECFLEAYQLVEKDLPRLIDLVVRNYEPARAEILEALKEKDSVHPSGRVIELGRYALWKRFVRYLDAKGQDHKEHIAFVLHPCDSQGGYSASFIGHDKTLMNHFFEHLRAANGGGATPLGRQVLLNLITQSLEACN